MFLSIYLCLCYSFDTCPLSAKIFESAFCSICELFKSIVLTDLTQTFVAVWSEAALVKAVLTVAAPAAHR